MSEEPEPLKCYLITWSSNSNHAALRLPFAVYPILIIEKKVDGYV